METNGNYYYDGAAPLRRSHILTSRVAKQPIYDPDLSVPLMALYSLGRPWDRLSLLPVVKLPSAILLKSLHTKYFCVALSKL